MRNETRNTLRRILAAVLVIVFVVSVQNTPITAYAQEQEMIWTHPGDGWHYLVGTDIRVKIENNAISIYGTGAIPDFDYWKLYERPWAGTYAESVYIEPTITSIGSYAFYNMEYLRNVSMSTSTFVKDMTCFDKICYMPIFRIHDSGVSTEMIGIIPYTSLDSILAMAQSNYNGACYILDTPAKAIEFQNKTNPTITNVYYASEKIQRLPHEEADLDETKNVPWYDVATYGNGNVATPICRLSELTPYASLKVAAQKKYQGRACYEAYAAYIEDYIFAATFNVTVMKGEREIGRSYNMQVEKVVERTDNELMYVLTIPAEFRLAGRQFRLLAIGNGVVNVYDDLDMDDTTITFATQTPTTAYALVYK